MNRRRIREFFTALAVLGFFTAATAASVSAHAFPSFTDPTPSAYR